MFKNIYFYRARLFPAVITSIPMLIFLNRLIAVEYHDALKNIYEILPIITNLGLSMAIVFLYIQVNRLTAKEVFQRLYFKEELQMPTTNHLLLKNAFYIDNIKNKIRDKIASKFDIVLSNLQEEEQDDTKARKQICIAVSQIKIALKPNSMLLQHNIEYGFWRNLIGGSLWAIIFSFAIYCYGRYYHLNDLKIVGIICFIVYFVPVILSKFIIKYYGQYYSKILYEQFLSIP